MTGVSIIHVEKHVPEFHSSAFSPLIFRCFHCICYWSVPDVTLAQSAMEEFLHLCHHFGFFLVLFSLWNLAPPHIIPVLLYSQPGTTQMGLYTGWQLTATLCVPLKGPGESFLCPAGAKGNCMQGSLSSLSSRGSAPRGLGAAGPLSESPAGISALLQPYWVVLVPLQVSLEKAPWVSSALGC